MDHDIDWVALIPERIPKVRAALEPVLDLYKAFDKFMERILSQVTTQDSGRTVRVETPNSLSGLLATSAPHLLIQLFFALLVIFFFLAGWTAMRKQTIVERPGWDAVAAVRSDRIFEVKSTYILQPGPASLTDGVKQLHAAIAGTAGAISRGDTEYSHDGTKNTMS